MVTAATLVLMLAAIVLLPAAAVVVWVVIGCAALAMLDDEQGRLADWAGRFPLGGLGIFVLLWPVMVPLVIWLRLREPDSWGEE